MRKRTYARGFGGNFQLFIFFLKRELLHFSAMARSADNIAHLLNVSNLDNSALADIIADYFEDCSSRDAEEVGSISEDFPETGT